MSVNAYFRKVFSTVLKVTKSVTGSFFIIDHSHIFSCDVRCLDLALMKSSTFMVLNVCSNCKFAYQCYTLPYPCIGVRTIEGHVHTGRLPRAIAQEVDAVDNVIGIIGYVILGGVIRMTLRQALIEVTHTLLTIGRNRFQII